MTRAEITTSVKANIGPNRTDKDAVIATGIQLALQDISKRHAFHGMFQEQELLVGVGEASVSLPAGSLGIYLVLWINDNLSHRIQLRTREWVLRRYPNPEAMDNGRPVVGYRLGDSIYLVPRPNLATTIRTIVTVPLTLDEDDSELTVPGLDEAVISYATQWVLKSMMMFTEASGWYQAYAMALAAAVKIDNEQPAIEHIASMHGTATQQLGDQALDPFAGHSMDPYGGEDYGS